MFFYDIVVSILCFIVILFNIRKLVSFDILFCRNDFVLFQGSKDNRRPKEDKGIKHCLKRYVSYSNLFFLSITCHLKQNLKEVSVHLSLNYLESWGEDSREFLLVCRKKFPQQFLTTPLGKENILSSNLDHESSFLDFVCFHVFLHVFCLNTIFNFIYFSQKVT